ncbi:EAL domain-containing protein [Eubacteriaceae bacterium ES2]|nr:EAL domain-containing protein [Eubacteriaceae bacterium ES2]
MTLNIILVLAFLYSSLLSFAMGLYTLKINKNSSQYRLFFMSTSAVAVWALSFAMIQSAKSLEAAFFFRRVGNIGIMFAYVFLLNFFIRVTIKKLSMRGKVLEGLMYLPTIILVYVYAVSGELSEVQNQILKTSYGYTTAAVLNFWEYFFYLYYVIYVGVAIFLVWRWHQKSDSVKGKKAARNILIAYLISVFLGTMSDVILNCLCNGDFPQIGPLITMIPSVVIFFSMISHGFMLKKNEPVMITVLDKETRKKISLNLLVVNGLICLLSFIMYNSIFKNSSQFLVSGFASLVFAVIILLNAYNKRIERYKDLLLISVMFFAVPVFTVSFFINGMSDIWGLAMVPILVALLFINRIALVMISATVILSQIATWLLRDMAQTRIPDNSFFIRFSILLIALRLAFYINEVYVARLKENTHIAYHDFITKLPNRRFFYECLERQLVIAQKENKKIGIFQMNIDNFKLYNDLLGHDGGDQLLTAVGEKIQKLAGEENFVAYFGGDTFLLVIRDLSDEVLTKLLAKLKTDSKKTHHIKNQEIQISMSIGIAAYPADGTDVVSLLKNAELAMYKAKENGGKQIYCCSLLMRQEEQKIQAIINHLLNAIENNELFLVFQPKVHAVTEKIEAVEALIRWQNKTLGMISPGIFIPLAEKAGLIGKIGDWVFEEACRQIRIWGEMGKKPLPVAINISGYQFQDARLLIKMQQAILKNNIDPRLIEVEVTESIAMNINVDVSKRLIEMKNFGMSVAIDDFGTGYSSLSRLHELPIDVLKIDKKFVDDIFGSEKNQAVINSIIDLAKNLDLKIVAEGAEIKEQVDFLKAKQCDYIQGYYYYKPLTATELNQYF